MFYSLHFDTMHSYFPSSLTLNHTLCYILIHNLAQIVTIMAHPLNVHTYTQPTPLFSVLHRSFCYSYPPISLLHQHFTNDYEAN